jgi:hypothetical protein
MFAPIGQWQALVPSSNNLTAVTEVSVGNSGDGRWITVFGFLSADLALAGSAATVFAWRSLRSLDGARGRGATSSCKWRCRMPSTVFLVRPSFVAIELAASPSVVSLRMRSIVACACGDDISGSCDAVVNKSALPAGRADQQAIECRHYSGMISTRRHA